LIYREYFRTLGYFGVKSFVFWCAGDLGRIFIFKETKNSLKRPKAAI